MKSRRNRKRGGGSKKTVKHSKSACSYTYLRNDPNIEFDRSKSTMYGCEEAVHKYDISKIDKYNQRGFKIPNKVRIELNEFFKSQKAVSKLTHTYVNNKFEYSYNGKRIDDSRLKWYSEIGSRILWYDNPTIPKTLYNKNPGCYVLRDTPLTLEEVESKTNEELNTMLSTLPCITDDMVNDWYRKGQSFFNPDYVAKIPLSPTPVTSNKV
jgi:hypothetical protein